MRWIVHGLLIEAVKNYISRELVAKFEELQKGGKLDNYVRRKNKKIAAKDRKRMRNS